MRPATNQVIAFPLRASLERDIHGALFRDVLAHMEAVCAALDHEAWRSRLETLSLREKRAASRAGMILTSRMMAAASLMIIARDWLADRLADDDAITGLGRLQIGLGDAERWWDDDNTPEELQQLCLIAEGLLARVRSAAERLRMAVEGSEGRAA